VFITADQDAIGCELLVFWCHLCGLLVFRSQICGSGNGGEIDGLLSKTRLAWMEEEIGGGAPVKGSFLKRVGIRKEEEGGVVRRANVIFPCGCSEIRFL
jgi:hypothetical protein